MERGLWHRQRHNPPLAKVFCFFFSKKKRLLFQWLSIQGRGPDVFRAGVFLQQLHFGGCFPVRLVVSGACEFFSFTACARNRPEPAPKCGTQSNCRGEARPQSGQAASSSKAATGRKSVKLPQSRHS